MATPDYSWHRSSPLGNSSDTTSPIYPDRPIRPLPKRRLHTRLSPEQQSSIIYPPAPPSSAPLFNFPYAGPAASRGPRRSPDPEAVNGRHQSDHDHHCKECGRDHSISPSDEEEEVISATEVAYPRNGAVQELPGGFAHAPAAYKPPPPKSTSSSGDGYESFENTHNQKKRKIPVSGGGNGHAASLSAEMANLGISSADSQGDEGSNGTSHFYGSGISATSIGSGVGVSGAGRGRYGRSGRLPNERRPLGASTSGLNAYRDTPTRSRREWSTTTSPATKDQGIISAAIANAAEQGPVTPRKGKENVSLLSQETTKTPPQKTQFTFTCESDSSNKMVWPGQNTPSFNSPTPHTSTAPVTTGQPISTPRRRITSQSSPGIPAAQKELLSQPLPQHMQDMPQQSQAPINGQHPTAQPKKQKSRRPPGSSYAYTARQRKIQQQYYNAHHPPKPEDIWICEFCEYESIFGHPPEALVRQYEIKDRQERKRLEEKRRLLEKARMKGRKGKKGNGKGAKSVANQPGGAANAQRGDLPPDQGYPDPDLNGNDYYDDDYDDTLDPPPATPVQTIPNGHQVGPPISSPLTERQRRGFESIVENWPACQPAGTSLDYYAKQAMDRAGAALMTQDPTNVARLQAWSYASRQLQAQLYAAQQPAQSAKEEVD